MEARQSKIRFTGLSKEQADQALKKYGKNEILVNQQKNWIKEYIKEYFEIFSIILIVAAALTYIAQEYLDAIVISIVIVLNSTISFSQKYKADKAVQKLQQLVAPKAIVKRNNQIIEISTALVVPGDVIILKAGMRIPADAFLIQTTELHVNESILTGESDLVYKNNESNSKVFMGTEVAIGEGIAIVEYTGLNTEFGKISALTQNTVKHKSPLTQELDHIAIFISKVAIFIALSILGLTVLLQQQPILSTLIFASAVAVATVPEGLPATITIALAFAVQRLVKKGVIVKQLNAVETLGATSTIVSDKTGTLTKNSMTVITGYSPYVEFDVSGVGYSKKGTIQITSESSNKQSNKLLQLIKLIGRHCSTTKVDFTTETIIGDPTEAALLTLSYKIKRPISTESIKSILPFNSNRKLSGALTSSKILVTGAPDILLKKCTKIHTGKDVVSLSETDKKAIIKNYNSMAKKALRTIALAYRPSKVNSLSEKHIKDLIFIGLVGIIDPPRPEIKQSLQIAAQAGIRTIMCTGDYEQTAKAIAKKLDLSTFSEHVFNHEDLQKLNNIELQQLLKEKENFIFARATPEDKLRIVQALKANQEIVAVTGDGINDAPALKQADIGIAMGITGTDVSKEAASLILSNDNFSSIIDAIKEGRTVYNNLRKFIFYIFSSNLGELITILIALLLYLPAPLTTILLLTINVGTDILPALALGIEKSKNGCMQDPPRNTSDKILSKSFILRITFVGSIIGILATFIFTKFLQVTDPSISSDYIYQKATTAVFVFLVLAQVFNSLNAKHENTPFIKFKHSFNKYLLGANLFTLALILFITQLPTLNSIFKTIPLSLYEWGYLTLLASLVWIIEDIRKLIQNKFKV